jgi:thymidylate synthase ThyX
MQDNYEEFSEGQLRLLERYVTNTTSHIFVLKNLPEVIKGALFSRYSRSSLGLRSLLLKEFIGNNDETAFKAISGYSETEGENPGQQMLAIQKAQNFYDRILDGYGDDSIGELGGAHLAIENVSMLAAKLIEDCRIGGSPLEKSTRYIYFDQKVNGEYLFYREPILMTSAYRTIYLETCNLLFETYGKLIPPMTAIMEQRFPKEPEVSKVAYIAALRAKVLDCLRGLLPSSTLTNLGIFGNGRFFEQLIHKLHCNNLAELQDIGRRSYDELAKVIPSFVRRSQPGHRTHQAYSQYYEAMQTQLKLLTDQHCGFEAKETDAGVRLIAHDPLAVYKVTAALLFAYSDKSYEQLLELCKQLPDEEIARILDGACSSRETRRQKSPRALEHANFTFEIVSDFGAYRDLHRHRMLTQERQLLTCNYGFYTPPEILGTDLESEYYEALCHAKEVYDAIACELPEEAQYVVPMAFNIRWYFHVNLRALQWLCELRSSPAGHPSYRHIAQNLAIQVCTLFPAFERFFKFVDYDGYEMGRIGQEQRKVDKAELT